MDAPPTWNKVLGPQHWMLAEPEFTCRSAKIHHFLTPRKMRWPGPWHGLGLCLLCGRVRSVLVWDCVHSWGFPISVVHSAGTEGGSPRIKPRVLCCTDICLQALLLLGSCLKSLLLPGGLGIPLQSLNHILLVVSLMALLAVFSCQESMIERISKSPLYKTKWNSAWTLNHQILSESRGCCRLMSH